MTPTDRIKQEAVKAFPIPVNISQQPSCMDKREGYIAGATATHDRAKELVDALEQIANSPVPANEREMQSWIETARSLATTSLEQWGGKEVGDEMWTNRLHEWSANR